RRTLQREHRRALVDLARRDERVEMAEHSDQALLLDRDRADERAKRVALGLAEFLLVGRGRDKSGSEREDKECRFSARHSTISSAHAVQRLALSALRHRFHAEGL